MPDLFIIAGPNGAGKTTAAMSLLPDILQCMEYVNADSIARAFHHSSQIRSLLKRQD